MLKDVRYIDVLTYAEAFRTKLQIFQVSLVPLFPKVDWIQRKQHQI